ncbi:MAG: hypothetical protein K2M55_04335 [Muribaculaceae bacterium]|nr:hypothetical protein [Muribaculaceae bacterium]
MMSTLKSLLAAAVAVTGIALTSCNDSESGGNNGPDRYVNFVTLAENTPEGSVMTFRKDGDSPLITLTSNQQFDTSIFKANTRVVVDYIPASGDGYASGPVTLVSAVNTEGGGAPVQAKTAEETRNWASDLVSVNLVQRTGEYLNLVFTASTRRDPKECAVYVDKATIGTECPCLHLIFEASDTGVADPYAFFASYDISEVWNAESTKRIRVYYADYMSPTHYTEITKILTENNNKPLQ